MAKTSSYGASDERRQLEEDLARADEELSRLRTQFEKYFAGIERVAPIRERDLLQRLLRKMISRPIFQSGLKFRVHQLNASFQTYNTMWERILREIDEGRYHRHVIRASERRKTIVSSDEKKPIIQEEPLKASEAVSEAPKPTSEVDSIHRQFEELSEATGYMTPVPSRKQIEALVTKQRTAIKERFGDKAVDFVVDVSEGMPKLKARLRK